MESQFETAYDQEALTVMAKALRKTIRKKRSRRSHILGTIVIAFALFLTLPLGNEVYVLTAKKVLTWLVSAIILLTLMFEDRINGAIAKRRMLPGLEKAVVTFKEDSYHSVTEIGSSDFKYSTIQMLVETTDYFVFIFSQNHAQIYSKCTLTGGTADEFRTFIQAATGKEIQPI
ncbi:MAG: YcxB family protein [Oscillospiraceae bacterium]|nr:YcxB family protein [Oscillospiraceae bacterium]